MSALASRKFSRAAIAAALTIAAGALFAGSAAPAMAECKYGTPHCVDPHRPLPEVKVPDDNGWVDPDCKYYGNCLPDNKAARRAPTKPLPVLKLNSKR
jgi:hypothetical protein